MTTPVPVGENTHKAALPEVSAVTESLADDGDELFDVVDESNKVINQALRRQCHEEGLLHRSTHIFLFRSRRIIGTSIPTIEVLLQQRSKEKKVGGGLWDVSVAEHVSAGENYLDASVRGIQEELSLDVTPDALVTVRQPYLSKQAYEEAGILDYMFTSTFSALYDESSHGRVKIDEAEVQNFDWWPVELVVKKSKADPSAFTRWLLIELSNIDLIELGKRIAAEL